MATSVGKNRVLDELRFLHNLAFSLLTFEWLKSSCTVEVLLSDVTHIVDSISYLINKANCVSSIFYSKLLIIIKPHEDIYSSSSETK